MKHWVVLAGLAACLAAAPAQAAHWNVDYAKSKLGFTVLWSKEPFSASFKSWKAQIEFDPADLAHARADVTVDLASEASDEADFDDGLKGAEGFQVSQFPTAHFTTTGFTHKAGDSYVATGKLSLKGVTKDVTLPFTLTIQGNQAHMKGSAVVMRTDYNIGMGQWSVPSSPVAHDVTVTIDIAATKQ
ncbi:MAG TPA: YceI family protein [Rhizomicrobium sp.]|nr:YceI family protein [Rhizomicrobium sp.]